MVYTNLDAEYLSNLATSLGNTEQAARLVRIADNLQKMDEKSVSAYSQGFREGEESVLKQNSNIVPKTGPSNLIEALAIWRGEVKKVPQVTKTAHKPTLTVADLDLDDDFEEYLAAAEQKVREARKKKNEAKTAGVRDQAKHQ